MRSTDSLVKIEKCSDGEQCVVTHCSPSDHFSIRRGYYQVKNMILIVSWEINMLR